ncbi:phosphatidylinositol kinase (PIK-D) [Achlya hypogyna]|uniref:Phosphatidylinositol kinase (PIK-D) n=1 Tax=Achlya hypogyna TaxID=1202772 RepID=A0A1V9ZJQ2_ACHHY|nr:phosphatidylinositol kinase (PIK-D) [Achlya hypogyna]
MKPVMEQPVAGLRARVLDDIQLDGAPLSPTTQLLELHEDHFEEPSASRSPIPDLSFSMMLETKSKHRSQSKKRLGYGRPSALSTLSEGGEDSPDPKAAKRNPFQYNSDETDADELARELKEQQAQEREDDSAWSHSDVAGEDVYRFVQPRRLSSWVQDDAVYACFKCHTEFTLLLRKHHCRACGRIFCNVCSNQRLVIPIDYESTPVSYALGGHAQYSYSSALASNATEVIGSLGYYVWSYNAPPPPPDDFTEFHGSVSSSSASFRDASLDEMHASAELERDRFLRGMTQLEARGVVAKFTPSAVPLHKLKQLQQAPKGSVLQRVCDDCASALQQRRQHYNTVRVFELCGWDIQTLRLLGQVCRKWHRASIMCLSTFRQIQYYLPSHPLSPREKDLLVRNRRFLAGHSKWLLQLVKAVDVSKEHTDDPVVEDILRLMQAPRQHNCMLTMCSRLCRHELECVDALEVLSNVAVQDVRLRNLCVGALQRKASAADWLSFLPIVLHSLSIERSASALGDAIVRQALLDPRFCSDLYWGLSVLAEDRRCRRKFDGFRQRLLLRLEAAGTDMAAQLLFGQEFVDILYKLPHRAERAAIVQQLQAEVAKSPLFKAQPLRLPVEPTLTIGGLEFTTLKVMRSAEAPLIVTCAGVEAADGGGGDRATYRLMYKRDDLRKDAAVQNIIRVMYAILKEETHMFNSALVTYRVVPTSSYDGLIEIVEQAHTLYAIIREHGSIMHFLHHYNGHRTLSDISTSFRESLAAYTVITFLLGVGDRHAENVMLTNDGNLFHIDYGFILGKDPKPLQPPMRLDGYMLEALGGPLQVEAFKTSCVVAFNCLRRHVSLFLLMLRLVVDAIPEITDFGVNYTQADLDAFVIERFLPGQSDEEAATALKLRMEGKFNEKIGLTLSDFVHAHASEKTVSKSMSSVKVGVESVGGAVHSVANSLTASASSLFKYVWGSPS